MDRVQEQWQKEKDSWTIEKRGLETKIHITEGRLKIVLSEVANAQFGHSTEDIQRGIEVVARKSFSLPSSTSSLSNNGPSLKLFRGFFH